MQTALSGMSAAETAIDVIGNNIANAQTRGFKASDVMFATQTYQTFSPGAAPNETSGGRNPMQVGQGVLVASISPDFSQGPLILQNGPSNLAIQGDGFFILEGSGGQRSYTRDGSFGLNAADELVSAQGDLVLGFPADENFQIQDTELSPIVVPLGKVVESSTQGTAELLDYRVTEDGRVQGVFSDGQIRDLGQLRLARFSNPAGMEQNSGNTFSVGPNSGLPQESDPQQAGAGQLLAGAAELSNTDLAQSLIDLRTYSNSYRANLQVLSLTFDMQDALINLGRKD
jgi:flagellar hook protein FlgE